MDASKRKEKLEELKKNQSNIVMTGIPLRYKGTQRTENVYRIPLDYLIYNRYNGRIGSEVLSYEKQNGELDASLDSDKKLIEKFLYDSRKDRNKITMDSLLKDGQQRYGIVTADGIIIDGNRRAMLLNRLFQNRDKLGYSYEEVEKCKYFLAIILPDDAEEKDIQQLETIYQMGEDDKVDYNPIEKYLKCKRLKDLGYSEKDIAEFMGEKKSEITKRLRVLTLMDEYLRNYQYDGIYTRLEETEGPFRDLDGYIQSYKGGKNYADWTYTDTDISNLKYVYFDYIRSREDGKQFRDIAKTTKDGSIFSYQELWGPFFENHCKNIPEDEETVEELRENNPGEDLSKLLKSRDNDWIVKAKGPLKGNLNRFTQKLEDKRAANKPAELLDKALSALLSVDTDQEEFYDDPHIEEMVKEINHLGWEMKKALEKG